MLHWFLPCNNVLLLSCAVVSDSLRSHGLQRSRLPLLNYIQAFGLMFTESVTPSNYLIHCCHLLLLPSIIFRI